MVIIFFFVTSLFTYWTPAPAPSEVEPTPTPTASAQPTTQPSPSPTVSVVPQTWKSLSLEGYAPTLAYAESWGTPITQLISFEAGQPDTVFDHTEVRFPDGPTIRLSNMARFEERDRRTELLDASVSSLKLDFIQKKVAETTPVFLPPVMILGKTTVPVYIENSTSTVRGVYYFAEKQDGGGVLTYLIANLMTSDEEVVQYVYMTGGAPDSKVACADATECSISSALIDWVENLLKPAVSGIK